MDTSKTNDHLILIEGRSATGKSASFMNLSNPERVAYINCENGKKLPFNSKFAQVTVTDPHQVPSAIAELQGNPNYDVIVIDSLSFLMQMYEQQRVVTAEPKNLMKSWQDYGSFFVSLMQQYVAASDKAIIFTCHVDDKYNESEMITETKAAIKGFAGKVGAEAYFSCVLMARRMKVKDLEKYEEGNSLLTITDRERALGFKYVFQTQHTTETIYEKMRSPIGMWSDQETFIDNDTNLVLERLRKYYS